MGRWRGREGKVEERDKEIWQGSGEEKVEGFGTSKGQWGEKWSSTSKG